MLRTFIERPVLSTVISIIIVVLGIIGMAMLPIEQYPDIAPPTVQISASYNGASADAVLKSVVIPIEEEVNGVEGMTYMTSTSSNSGSADIQVFFEQGTDPDMAAVNVQNRVSRAEPLLPSEVTQTGVEVYKSQTSTLMMIMIYTENPEYDGQFIQNYADINIIPQIKRVNGVGNAQVYGAKTYSMRIWLKPDVMATYRISPAEVIAALTDQNIEAAPGELGQGGNQQFQYTLKYTGRLETEQQFSDIIVRSTDGLILRLSDVADIELGSLNYTVESQLNGKSSVVLAVSQTPGTNASEVIKNVKVVLDEARPMLPPGVQFKYMMDASEFLDASISKVIHTLVEAFILVFLVVFVFLQDIRSTIIPAIAVPVAIIGTFFFLLVFGFSINMLTLFALVLAIGIVVDDAIVVVEAVHSHMEDGEHDPKQATVKAMGEIAPAIVSITLVMASVFIPVSFVGGTSGVFFKQFGLTLAVAIFISAINALTLSPALCALLLKHTPKEAKKKGFFGKMAYYFNVWFANVTRRYQKGILFLTGRNRKWIPLTIVAVFGVVLFGLMKIIPSGFIPQEDSGAAMGFVTLPPGASMERTQEVLDEVKVAVMDIPHVRDVGFINGYNFMAGQGSSYATFFVKLDPWEERDITMTDVVGMLYQRTAHIKDASLMFMGTPTLQGFGIASGVSLELQDRTGGDINEFFGIAQQFLGALNMRDEVQYAMTTFDPRFPQKVINVNMAKIKDAGLTLTEVMTTMQAYIGSMYVSNFNKFGKQYRVMVQSSPDYRETVNDLDGMFIRTASGQMTPITEFIQLEDVTGPQQMTRFNLYSSISVTIIPNEGVSAGELIDIVEATAPQVLPQGYSFEYSGISREDAKSGNTMTIIFIICIIFVYLLLSALYESYILPLAVLLSLPVGLAGIFVFVYFSMKSGSGIVNNTYVQIALVMMIGLLAKNAILIVEYAIQRRQRGMSISQAALSGAVARLRPILMTSFAFIFGLMPLAFATGAGAVGNQSIGISAIGGMLIGTLIGVFVIPALYIIFQTLQEKVSGSPRASLEAEEAVSNH